MIGMQVISRRETVVDYDHGIIGIIALLVRISQNTEDQDQVSRQTALLIGMVSLNARYRGPVPLLVEEHQSTTITTITAPLSQQILASQNGVFLTLQAVLPV